MTPTSRPAPLRRPLAHAIVLALALPVIALAEEPQDIHRKTAHELDRVVVTATPLHQTADELSRQVEVLAGERLDEEKSATLGRTLERLPGIQSGSFGPGVGRPVIRGLDGARVQVVSDGMGSGDVSTISADHAVSIEPFLADRIEVLKGPATLLYGSGAIGGAVNVVDGRAPHALPDRPISGRAEWRAGSVDDERTGMFRLDAATHTDGSGLVFHADGLLRRTGDLRIPGHAESAAKLAAEGETPDPATRGRLPNSALRTASGGLGVTWVGERSHFGIGSSLFDTRYGVPGHSHAHDDDHGHDHDHDDHADEHGAEGGVRIALDQRRHDAHGGLDDAGPFKTVRFKYANTVYRHTESENAVIGTVFDNRTDEARLELVHRDVAGWQGAFGLQWTQRDFDAAGAEAFVPPTRSRDNGLFWLGQRDLGPARLEIGARLDRARVAAESNPLLPARQDERRFQTHHLSASLRWNVNDALSLRFGADRAQRPPTPEELFSNGLHVATAAVEIGDDRLRPETADRFEMGAEWKHGRWRLAASAFHARYRDFIHLADLWEHDAGHGGHDHDHPLLEGGFPVRLWTQDDARFHGFEAEANATLFESARGHVDIRLFADAVRGRVTGGGHREVDIAVVHGNHLHHHAAELDTGGNLPRISPDRFGAELRWESHAWRASIGAIRTLRQDRVARGETPTPGHTLVDAHIAWHGDTAGGQGWEVFADGRNLLDREIRPHTSYLKDLAPLAGRGVVAGVRFFF